MVADVSAVICLCLFDTCPALMMQYVPNAGVRSFTVVERVSESASLRSRGVLLTSVGRLRYRHGRA